MDKTNLFNPHLEGDPFMWKAGPVGILLAHGLTATPAEVRPLALYLHEQGYTVAGPLLAGHGTSPQDLNRTPWQAWVKGVEKTYHHLAACCDTVFVGGESTGAMVALYLASRQADIAGILTYAPAIRLALSRVDTVKLHVLAPFMTAVPKGPIDAREFWQGYRVNPLRSALQLMQLQQAVRPRLPGIQQPIMIVQGQFDMTIHPTSGQMIYDEIGSTYKEFHWLENSNHVVIIDKERHKVSDLTLKFIQRVMGEQGSKKGARLQEDKTTKPQSGTATKSSANKVTG